MLRIWTRGETFECTEAEFRSDNVDDEDLVARVERLPMGGVYWGGGGASPEFRILNFERRPLTGTHETHGE